MPATQADYDKVKALREQAKSARATYGSLSSAAETFPHNVMEKVRSARADRGMSQLAMDVGESMGHLGRAGAEVRGRLADVNPLQTDVITARERAANLTQLGREAQFGQETAGTIGEAVEGGAATVRGMAQQALVEAEQKKQEAADLMEMLEFDEMVRQFDERIKLEREKLTEGGTETEAERESAYLTNLQKDVIAGNTLQDVMQKYSTVLPTDDILQIYNINSPYGVAQESPRELEQRFGVQPSKTALEEQEVENVITGLEDIKGKIGQASSYGDVVALQTQKKSVGQWLARLVETGRLSDADREFYQKQLPNNLEFFFLPNVAKQKLDQVISDLQIRITGSASGGAGGDWE